MASKRPQNHVQLHGTLQLQVGADDSSNGLAFTVKRKHVHWTHSRCRVEGSIPLEALTWEELYFNLENICFGVR